MEPTSRVSEEEEEVDDEDIEAVIRQAQAEARVAAAEAEAAKSKMYTYLCSNLQRLRVQRVLGACQPTTARRSRLPFSTPPTYPSPFHVKAFPFKSAARPWRQAIPRWRRLWRLVVWALCATGLRPRVLLIPQSEVSIDPVGITRPSHGIKRSINGITRLLRH